MIGRRGLFRGAMALIGGGAAASVADANPNIPIIWTSGNKGRSGETPVAIDLPDWFDKIRDDFHNRPKWEGFDLDLGANRSMSYPAKIIIQRRRDKERRGFLEKMREKAMKEIGLNS